jgi:hypothetical protein
MPATRDSMEWIVVGHVSLPSDVQTSGGLVPLSQYTITKAYLISTVRLLVQACKGIMRTVLQRLSNQIKKGGKAGFFAVIRCGIDTRFLVLIAARRPNARCNFEDTQNDLRMSIAKQMWITSNRFQVVRAELAS